MTRPVRDEATADAVPAHGDPLIVKAAAGRSAKSKGMGFVYATIPVVVFVTANALSSLTVTLAVSVAVGLGITVFRIVNGERVISALGSLAGVALAAAIVGITGSAKNYFVVGIWAYFAGFLITALSLVIRRPVTGLIWNFLHGRHHPWREDRSVLRAHVIATLAAAVVLGARFGVQQWLYLADSTNGLGIARIAMGSPMSMTVAVVIVWAFRRSSKRLLEQPGQPATPPDEQAP